MPEGKSAAVPTFVLCPKCGRRLYRFLRTPVKGDVVSAEDFEACSGMPAPTRGTKMAPCCRCGYTDFGPNIQVMTDIGLWPAQGGRTDAQEPAAPVH